jgi:hypothetical protein
MKPHILRTNGNLITPHVSGLPDVDFNQTRFLVFAILDEKYKKQIFFRPMTRTMLEHYRLTKQAHSREFIHRFFVEDLGYNHFITTSDYEVLAAGKIRAVHNTYYLSEPSNEYPELIYGGLEVAKEFLSSEIDKKFVVVVEKQQKGNLWQ